MTTSPALTLVPAHVVETAPTLTAASMPVHPDTRTGCAWWVVPAPAHVHHAA